MNRGFLSRLDSLAERHGGRTAIAALCAIVAVGVGARAYYAAEKVTDPVPQPDSLEYYDLAESLYLDHVYDSPTTVRDDGYHPGSPLFHAAVWFATGGVHPLASRLLLALLSAAMIVAVYLLGRRLALPPSVSARAGPDNPTAPARDERAERAATISGLIAAALIAVHPSSIDFFRSHMNEPGASILLVCGVVAFLWASERRSPWAWLAPGGLLGLCALFRPETLAVAAALAVVAAVWVLRDRGRGAATAAVAVFAVAFVVAIAPWTVRNYLALDRFVPISTGGGNALFIGSYIPGDGDHWKTYHDHRDDLLAEVDGLSPARRAFLLSKRAELGDVLTAYAAAKRPGEDRDRALAALGREQLWDDVSERPLDYLGMLAAKGWNMWGVAAASGPEQGRAGVAGQWFHRLSLLLAIVGFAVLAAARRREALVLAIVIGGATLIGLLLLAPPRRQVDLLPLTSALAACGAVWVWARLAIRSTPGSGPAPAGPGRGASASSDRSPRR